jgi:hypothetical protein
MRKPAFFIIMMLTIIVSTMGCSKKDENISGISQREPQSTGKEKQKIEASEKRIKEGRIQYVSKQNCVRETKGYIFLSKPTTLDIEKSVKEAIDSAFSKQASKPVLWVQLIINISELFGLLREQDPNLESFNKDDFIGLVSGKKLIPIASTGIIEVRDGIKSLKQDILFSLPEALSDLEIVIGRVSLVKFGLN